MTDEQLVRLDQNLFHAQALEFLIVEATALSKLLEEMDRNPVTPERRESIRLQCERMKETLLVLQQFRGLVSDQERSCEAALNNMAGVLVAA